MIRLTAAALLLLGFAVSGRSDQPTEPEDTDWIPYPQAIRDEFNTTLRPELAASVSNKSLLSARQLGSLRRVLLRQNYSTCCGDWRNLTANAEIQDDLKRRYGRAKMALTAADLMNELRQTFYNITYLSIDGQEGANEMDKYYIFNDSVEYFLRLLRVAQSYLSSSSADEDADFTRTFRRQLKSVEFKVNQDPTVSSFIRELQQSVNSTEQNFTYYEDFIRYTKFGQHYARNVSMVRESVAVAERICSHLIELGFSSNYTRPSKQYEMIRRMSLELYSIRYELLQQINPRILATRRDVRKFLMDFQDLVRDRPYIRLLGDEFSSSPAYFSSNVRQLAHLLDLYTTNSLTQVSFYDQLSQLPEEFIVLGSTIARDYELREIPRFTRYDSDYFNEEPDPTHFRPSGAGSGIDNTTSSVSDPRKSGKLSMLAKLIG